MGAEFSFGYTDQFSNIFITEAVLFDLTEQFGRHLGQRCFLNLLFELDDISDIVQEPWIDHR